MALIKLINGHEAIVDDWDVERLSKRKWRPVFAGKNKHIIYAISQRGVSMHRFVLNAQKGQVVDHINGNGLDNRRCNLRICTQSQNLMNQRKQDRQTSSKYKGVRLHCDGKWEVRIKANGVRKTIGRFDNEIDAAIAYNIAAKEWHGRFARLNDVETPNDIRLPERLMPPKRPTEHHKSTTKKIKQKPLLSEFSFF